MILGRPQAPAKATWPGSISWCAPRKPLPATCACAHKLASMLRGRAPLYAGGIAALGALVTDASSPAYLGDRDALTRRLRVARAAMSGGELAGPKTRNPKREPSAPRPNDLNKKGGTR